MVRNKVNFFALMCFGEGADIKGHARPIREVLQFLDEALRLLRELFILLAKESQEVRKISAPGVVLVKLAGVYENETFLVARVLFA